MRALPQIALRAYRNPADKFYCGRFVATPSLKASTAARPLACCWRLLARRKNPLHDRSCQLIFSLSEVSVLVFYAEYENRQLAFFVEVLFGYHHWQYAVQISFPVSSLVAVPPHETAYRERNLNGV